MSVPDHSSRAGCESQASARDPLESVLFLANSIVVEGGSMPTGFQLRCSIAQNVQLVGNQPLLLVPTRGYPNNPIDAQLLTDSR